MRQIFAGEETEGALLGDATNAFDSINQQAALHNISIMCPHLAQVLFNTYQAPVRCLIQGGGEISSTEGNTQGDPLAMAMHTPILPATTPEVCLLCTRSMKMRMYGQHVLEIKHGVFTPLILSTSGGMGREAQTSYKRLGRLSVSERNVVPSIMGWLRCKLSFAIFRSAVMCIRGRISFMQHAIRDCSYIANPRLL